jgi:outer membrane protein assembly factor BamE
MQKEARTVGDMSRNFVFKTYRGSRVRRAVLVAALAALAGCSTYDNLTQRVAQSITPYRITVVQGNFVSQEAAAKMRVGMSRAEVKAVLGTPLLTDMFHADRWDYLFYFKRGSTAVVQQRDFVVHFENDRVASWEGGNDLPSELELLADIDGDKRGKKAKARAAAAAAAASQSSATIASSASAPQAAASAPTDAASAPAPAADAGVDPNAQAAQAANRAVNQVPSSPSGRPPVRSGAPTVRSGAPAAGGGGATPQFQFHRQPQPASPNESQPVGPTGTESRDSSGAANQPVSSTGAGKDNAGG